MPRVVADVGEEPSGEPGRRVTDREDPLVAQEVVEADGQELLQEGGKPEQRQREEQEGDEQRGEDEHRDRDEDPPEGETKDVRCYAPVARRRPRPAARRRPVVMLKFAPTSSEPIGPC